MDRSSRASAQSPPAMSFQRVPPPDWPPRMSRASALEHWLSSPPPGPPSPDWPTGSPYASRPRATTAQGVASRPRATAAQVFASRPRRATVRSRGAIFSPTELPPSPPPPARRSARKRKAPETLSPSPEPVTSRKKRAAPEKPPAKKPPPETTPRPPGKPKTDPDEDDVKQQDCDSNCCICMTEPEPQEVASINGCEHSFCFGCIEKWADRENTCPLCKTRFTKIERKTKKGKSTVKVKEKSQRSEFTSSIALEGLFGELGRSGIAFESFFARLGGSRFVNTQVARIIVGGMELGSNGGPGSSTAASRPSTRAYVARRPSEPGSRVRDVEDIFGRDDDESDSEDDLGFSSFVNSMRMGASLRRTAGPSFSFSSSRLSHSMPPPPPPARNFAVNSNDVTAGRSIETPLEICDSDDDDEVVVVETRPASARRL